MPQSVITARNLSKAFRIKQKRSGFAAGLRSLVKPSFQAITAVDNISFSVERGEFLGFIGPNGAGKSTTIKMLTGILYPDSGSLSVLGFNPTKERKQLAYKIGSVFGQKPQLWYHLAAQDTYDLFSRIYQLDQAKYQKRLAYLVEAFEIQPLLNVPVRKLSLGQRMRCEIVASLIHQPEVIFLDEPTIGLDVIAKQKIREVLRHLNEEEKVTVFLTSHDAGDIESLTKRTIIINHGRVVFDDTTSKLKRRYITNKIVELATANNIEKFEFKGGEVLKRTSNRLKVRVDTSQAAIDKLLSYALANFQVEDINIYDPPMEEIIATIYKEQG